jgi:biotin carboxyl carrier protein
MRFRVALDGASLAATVEARADQVPRGVIVRELPRSAAQATTGARRFVVLVDGWHFVADVEPADLAELRERASRGADRGRPHERFDVRAQIPGRVVSVRVAPGDGVEAGQPLLSIEAMKMENEVRAPRAGTIARVAVAAGMLVELGDELIVLE